MTTTAEFEKYPFTVQPGSVEDGSGFFVSFPDLPGCLADGETYEEAIANARDAFAAWMLANTEEGREVPKPGEGVQPVKFVLRLPHSVHKLLTRAGQVDGVSMNTMATMLIVEGLARRDERQLPQLNSLQLGIVSPQSVDLNAQLSQTWTMGYGLLSGSMVTTMTGSGSGVIESTAEVVPLSLARKRRVS